MKINYCLTILLILLCTTGSLFAANKIWTGNVSSDWNDPNNWLPIGVPDFGSTVAIDNAANNPVVSTSNAMAGTIDVVGILTIASTGTLTLNGFANSGFVALSNHSQGTVVNQGTIIIGLTTSVGNYGIGNEGIFNNNAGGQINITLFQGGGLYNNGTGTFNNAGNITIGVGTYPLQNLGAFNNNTGGQITLVGVSGAGICLDNISGIFTNAGNISIGATQSTGIYGLQNKATFNNIAGQITIDHSPSGGLFNFGGTFNNQAAIILGSVPGLGNLGLENNNGTFNNQAGGQITINYANTFGILNRSGTFDNSGTINIGNIASNGLYGIETRSTFNNNTGGQIHIDQSTTAGLWLNNVYLNNAGTIVIGKLAPITPLKTTNATFINGTGGIYGGSGTVIQPNNFVNSGGTLSPGYDTTGILTFGFNANFTNTSLSIEVNGTGAPGVNYDQLITSNAPGLSGGTLDVSINCTPALGDRVIILKSSLQIADTFATVTGLPANWHLVYSPYDIFLLYGPLQSTWTGTVKTDWFDAGNWTHGVPHVSCQAIIPDVTNDPVIGAAGAVAMSVSVQGGGSLTLAAGGTLTIKTLLSQGLLNQGTVQNNGTINVSRISGNNNYGIRNEAVFNNSTGATLNIENPFTMAFYNDTLATFSNHGSIIIGANAVTGLSGIENQGTFNNHTGGQISIDRLGSSGIAFTNMGLFNNEANVNIGASSWSNPINIAIANGGAFNNNTGGQIYIDRVTAALYNIGVLPSNTFNNQAIIHIGSLSGGNTITYGIFNYVGNFNNNPGGQIHIDRATTGILSFGDTLTNAGTFTLGALATVTTLVDNYQGNGAFSNNTGGVFTGKGNINPASLIHVGGTFSPGHPFGTLTFTAGEDFNAGILNMEISETAGVISKDSIRVNGNIALTGATLNIVAGGTVPGGLHQLFSFNGNTGNTHFSSVNFPSTCTGCSLLYLPNAIWLNNPSACAPNLSLTNQTLPTGTYRSQGDLTATSCTAPNGNVVEFKSDTGVLLQAGFTVEVGSELEILIEGCQ